MKKLIASIALLALAACHSETLAKYSAAEAQCASAYPKDSNIPNRRSRIVDCIEKDALPILRNNFYPNHDLAALRVSKMREIAIKRDAGSITEDQALLEMAQYNTYLTQLEINRNEEEARRRELATAASIAHSQALKSPPPQINGVTQHDLWELKQCISKGKFCY